jgi:CRISPR-associated endonuclease Cas1
MLSFGYTLIYHRLASVLKDQGFNPRVGFFHQGRGSHAALASDMMEELRHIVERIVLALIHLKEIKEGDFIMSDKKGVSYTRLKGEGFRTFIHRFETTMAKEFTHYENEKLSYNQYLDEMARKLKRSLKLNLQYTALRID